MIADVCVYNTPCEPQLTDPVYYATLFAIMFGGLAWTMVTSSAPKTWPAWRRGLAGAVAALLVVLLTVAITIMFYATAWTDYRRSR